MRPTDADALMPLFIKKAYGMKDRHGVKPGDDWLLNYDDIKDVIDNAPPVEPQKIVTIPPELIEKLASCVVDIVGNIDWEKAIEAYKARPQGEWIPVGERLPEGKIDPMTNDFELVLCSTVWKVVRPYKFGKPIGHSEAHFWSGGGIMDDYVIAWKPLPEPYKETENDSRKRKENQ